MTIGINGMGRIGRTFFRVLYRADRLHLLKAVNDIMPKQHLIYLLQYDTVRGTFPVKIEETAEGLRVDDHEITVHQYEQPKDIPWGRGGVEVVVEATGRFSDSDSLYDHIQGGAKYSILTTTGSDDVPLYVTGANEKEYNGEQVFSVGSCTVNGSAPLVKILEPFNPESIYLNVIHAYSARQNILDSYYPEIRRSRASADNIIPLNINLDLSLQRLFPALENKIKSITSRVPIPCGVLADMTVILNSPPPTSRELSVHLEKAAVANDDIMAITHDPIVSSDVLHNPHSMIVDSEFTHIMGNHAKILVWFDNEWGFSNRLLGWAESLT